MADEHLPEVFEKGDTDTLPAIAKDVAPRYHRFARYLALEDNVVKAGRLAGFAVESGGQSMLYKVRQLAPIQALVEHYQALFASRSATSPEKLLVQLTQMANVDVTETLDDDWQIKRKSDIPEDIRRAATSIEITPTRYGKKVKLGFPKEFAIEKLLRIHGMLQEDKADKDGFSLVINMGMGMPAVRQSTIRRVGPEVDIPVSGQGEADRGTLGAGAQGTQGSGFQGREEDGSSPAPPDHGGNYLRIDLGED